MKDYLMELEDLRNEALDEEYRYNEYLNSRYTTIKKKCDTCGKMKFIRREKSKCYLCRKEARLQPFHAGNTQYPNISSFGEMNNYLGL